MEVDEKDDIQLQRAVDILKTWNIFKGLPKEPQPEESKQKQ